MGFGGELRDTGFGCDVLVRDFQNLAARGRVGKRESAKNSKVQHTVGERGVLKGCAAPVEVAAGGPAVRGLDAVAVAASNWEIEDVNVREGMEGRRENAPLRRHERQIIFVLNWVVVV